MDKCLAWCHST